MNNNYKDRLRTNANPEEADSCCESPMVESKDGDNVCLNCGMIIGRNLVGNERRAYTVEEVNKRRRTEPRWREFGPRTMLPNSKIDSKGRLIGAKGKTLFSRLSKIQNSLIYSIESNFWESKTKLKMLTSKMNISEHIKETSW